MPGCEAGVFVCQCRKRVQAYSGTVTPTMTTFPEEQLKSPLDAVDITTQLENEAEASIELSARFLAYVAEKRVPVNPSSESYCVTSQRVILRELILQQTSFIL